MKQRSYRRCWLFQRLITFYFEVTFQLTPIVLGSIACSFSKGIKPFLMLTRSSTTVYESVENCVRCIAFNQVLNKDVITNHISGSSTEAWVSELLFYLRETCLFYFSDGKPWGQNGLIISFTSYKKLAEHNPGKQSILFSCLGTGTEIICVTGTRPYPAQNDTWRLSNDRPLQVMADFIWLLPLNHLLIDVANQ